MSEIDPQECQEYEMAYYGHGRGLVVTQPKSGQFAERRMTESELAARAPAMLISKKIYELATYATFAYIKCWTIIHPAIEAAIVAERKRWRAEFSDIVARQKARRDAVERANINDTFWCGSADAEVCFDDLDRILRAYGA